MKLSPIDHLFIGTDAYSIQFIFQFEKGLDREELQKSLDQALNHFSVLKKKLVKKEESLELGPEYQVTIVEEVRSENLEVSLSNSSLTEHHQVINALEDEELMRVKLVKYANTDLLVVNISHCLVDGYSYFMFLTAWSQIHQGKQLPFKPLLDRTILNPKTEYNKLYMVENGFHHAREFGDFSTNPFEIFKLSKAKVKEELVKACEASKIRLSENDIISVLLLREYAQKWNGPGDELLVSTAFDFRRVNRDVGRFYFGNAVLIAEAKFDFTELFELPLFKCAEKIRQASSSIRKEVIEDALSGLENYRLTNGLQHCQNFHVAHPDRGFLFTNLSRMPSEQVDFGTGPAQMVMPLVPGPRTLVILEGGENYNIRVSPPIITE